MGENTPFLPAMTFFDEWLSLYMHNNASILTWRSLFFALSLYFSLLTSFVGHKMMMPFPFFHLAHYYYLKDYDDAAEAQSRSNSCLEFSKAQFLDTPKKICHFERLTSVRIQVWIKGWLGIDVETVLEDVLCSFFGRLTSLYLCSFFFLAEKCVSARNTFLIIRVEIDFFSKTIFRWLLTF